MRKAQRRGFLGFFLFLAIYWTFRFGPEPEVADTIWLVTTGVALGIAAESRARCIELERRLEAEHRSGPQDAR